jgi:DNA-binding transcriptional MerR regulator
MPAGDLTLPPRGKAYVYQVNGMKIGELARHAGVTTKAVRYYESLGLVTAGRLANGYRDYNEHDVRLVREIRTLSQLGIAVGDTRPFLECWPPAVRTPTTARPRSPVTATLSTS